MILRLTYYTTPYRGWVGGGTDVRPTHPPFKAGGQEFLRSNPVSFPESNRRVLITAL